MFKNLNLAALGMSGRQSEVIELTLSHGFKGLDLDLVEFGHQVQASGLPHARRLIDSARLRIGSVRLSLDWNCDTAGFDAQLERLAGDIQLAQQIGCTRAITDIDPASDNKPYHENFELHRRRYGKLAELLGRQGLKLGLGFLAPLGLRKDRTYQFIQTADAFLLLLKSISSPNIGMALDLWHWHLGGGTIDQIRALGAGKIVTVGLADADPDTTAENADRAVRQLPGATGVIDCAEVLSLLSAGKYDGPVTALPSPSIFVGQSRERIAKQTAEALDKVWKAAGLQTARAGMVSRV
ncbi:MAG TPA: TIM barrel protein [Pirellulales bacterium]